LTNTHDKKDKDVWKHSHHANKIQTNEQMACSIVGANYKPNSVSSIRRRRIDQFDLVDQQDSGASLFKVISVSECNYKPRCLAKNFRLK
jgi:hypothetical protein